MGMIPPAMRIFFTPLRILNTLFALLLLTSPLSAEPAASPWSESEQTSVRLISAASAVGKADTLSFGLHFKMQPGWKIYWRSPGDAGYPPSLDWAGSSNLKDAAISWPLPHRFSVLGLESIGYKDEVVLPLTLRLQTPGETLKLRTVVDFLTCSDICVPYKMTLAMDLPPGPAVPSSFAHQINRYSVQVPGDGSAHGVRIEKAEATGSGKDWIVRVTASADQAFDAPDLFVEGPNVLVFAKPDVRFSENMHRAVLEAKVWGVEDLPPGGLINTTLTFTLGDGERGAEKTLVVQPGTTDDGTLMLLTILALAVLGGLILNLMPCVLPVLSIKLLGVVSHGGGDRRHVRLSFIATSAGIVTAFLILASALVGLKEAGMSIGWGIQFQQPVFLIFMAIVVTLFACNLWGFFEIRLPQALADMGEQAGRGPGLGSHFLTGAFATLLATPCSAPFLGTAVGFALARDASDIFMVFAALGVGLSLPYLIIATLPGLATRLPRPGRWMIILRRILGFALAATTVWLTSILVNQIGDFGAGAIAALMLAMVLAIYVAGRLERPWLVGGSTVTVLALLALMTPSLLPTGASSVRAAIDDPAFKGIWQPFAPEAIAGLVADGKIVFVDVNADWCLTCQINKGVVLSNPEILDKLRHANVIAMQADWTLPDDKIARYLARFQRYGIPFNALYGPGAPQGMTLPELLSHAAVMEGFEKAAGRLGNGK